MQKQIDPEGNKSKTVLWIVIGFLVIIIGSFIYYLVVFSIEGVRNARQTYYEQVAEMEKRDIEVTIIEGWRREQIALKLVEKGVLPSSDDFMAKTQNMEGYLFPDTYRFFPNSTVDEVLKKISTNYEQKTKNLNLSKQTLILASIIERESSSDNERAKISGVYENRLNSGQKLEADPTAQFARDDVKCQMSGVKCQMSNYWQPITKEEIDSTDSPYNTYKYVDLPPSPICNPGLKSIEAALNPEKNDFYYFFHAQDGQLVLSRTLADHNHNKTKYGVSR